MKSLIKMRVMLESTFSRVAEDVRLNGFFMEILASLTIRAVSSLMVLLARLGLVLDMSQNLSLEFVSSMSKTTLITKLALSSQFPSLAQFGLVLSLIVLDKLASLFRVSKLLTLRLNINLELVRFREIYGIRAANCRRESLEVRGIVIDRVPITKIIRGTVSFIFRSVCTSGN